MASWACARLATGVARRARRWLVASLGAACVARLACRASTRRQAGVYLSAVRAECEASFALVRSDSADGA